MAICIRVRAKSTNGKYRVITVGEGVACDCAGFDGRICSHIDAVLVAQETAMVHDDDLPLIPEAIGLTAGQLTVPDYWRASWRRELAWRGLTREGRTRRPPERKSDRPLVCFTGKSDRPRGAMIAEAKAAGWDVVNSPSRFTDVLVIGDINKPSAKLKAARENGTTVVTPDEWTLLMVDGVLPS